jgi:hypothetical protein
VQDNSCTTAPAPAPAHHNFWHHITYVAQRLLQFVQTRQQGLACTAGTTHSQSGNPALHISCHSHMTHVLPVWLTTHRNTCCPRFPIKGAEEVNVICSCSTDLSCGQCAQHNYCYLWQCDCLQILPSPPRLIMLMVTLRCYSSHRALAASDLHVVQVQDSKCAGLACTSVLMISHSRSSLPRASLSHS